MNTVNIVNFYNELLKKRPLVEEKAKFTRYTISLDSFIQIPKRKTELRVVAKGRSAISLCKKYFINTGKKNKSGKMVWKIRLS